MKDRTTKEIISSLKKKGFELTRNGDHKIFELIINGRKAGIRTKVSHGNKTVHKNILSKMAKQIKISNAQFNDLIECPLDLNGLLRILQQKNLL